MWHTCQGQTRPTSSNVKWSCLSLLGQGLKICLSSLRLVISQAWWNQSYLKAQFNKFVKYLPGSYVTPFDFYEKIMKFYEMFYSFEKGSHFPEIHNIYFWPNKCGVMFFSISDFHAFAWLRENIFWELNKHWKTRKIWG